MKIRHKTIIAFLLISALSIISISVVVFSVSKKNTEKQIRNNLEVVVKAKKTEIEDLLYETIEHIELFNATEDVQIFINEELLPKEEKEYDAKYINNYLKKWSEVHDYNALYLLSNSGDVVASSETGASIYQVKKRYNDLLEKTIKEKKTQVKDVHKNVNNEIIMCFIAPIFDKVKKFDNSETNVVVGFLVAELNFENMFTHHLNWISKTDKTGEVLLVRRNNDEIEFLNNLKLKNELALDLKIPLEVPFAIPIKLAIEHKAGAIKTLDYRQKEVIAAYDYIPLTGWGIVAKIDTAEAFEPIFKLREMIILISLLIFFITIVSALYASRVITKSLKKLQEGADVVARGKYNHKISIEDKDEVGDLSRAFDKMSVAIRRSKMDLDKKVEQQTNQIKIQNKKLEKRQKAMINVLGDIEREKKELAKERDKINKILQSIGDGVFVLDKDYKIVLFNEAASEITGFKNKEVIGKRYDKILKFIREKDKSINKYFIKDTMEYGKITKLKNHTFLVKKDGKKIAVADSSAPLVDAKGNIFGCVVVFRDATKEVEIDRMKSEFVSLASHQLNTPLTGIKWFAELVLNKKSGKLNKQQEEYIKNIHKSNEAMIRLVYDLLNVSRIETGRKFVIAKKETNISRLLNECIKENQVLARQHGVSISIGKKISSKLSLNIDDEKIKQVFNNLLSNAVKYSKEKSIVSVGHKKSDKEEIFFVKNYGIGIPKKQQNQVFQKLFRADNASTLDVSGTGLGLYIAKSIIESHGGKIWFESIENKTTTFFVSFPKK